MGRGFSGTLLTTYWHPSCRARRRQTKKKESFLAASLYVFLMIIICAASRLLIAVECQAAGVIFVTSTCRKNELEAATTPMGRFPPGPRSLYSSASRVLIVVGGHAAGVIAVLATCGCQSCTGRNCCTHRSVSSVRQPAEYVTTVTECPGALPLQLVVVSLRYG